MDQRHVVKFFDDEENLFRTVGAFLGEALAAGSPALVIAMPARLPGILRALGESLSRARRDRPLGDLLCVDAEATLSRFMDRDRPDPARFRTTIGELMTQVTRGGEQRGPVHAYGEMVNVLRQRGFEEATLRLEHLWNEVAVPDGVSLLCGYRLGEVSGDVALLQRVCCLHSGVLAPSHVPNPPGSAS